MNRHIGLTAAVFAWVLSGSFCLARDDAADGLVLRSEALLRRVAPAKREDRIRRQRPPVRHKALAALIESFKLADDKAQQVEQILGTHRQAMANWAKEHGPQLRELKARAVKAKQDSDPEAAKAAAAEMKKIMGTRKAVLDGLLKQLGEVLSAEQLVKVRSLLTPPQLNPKLRIAMAAVKKLKLTDEQSQHVKKIHEQMRADLREAGTHEAKEKVIAAAIENIRKLLTEEQLEQLGKITARLAHRGRRNPLAALDLTGDQKVKITAIRKEMHEKIKAAETAGAKRAIVREMREKIDAVLTDEQRAKLRKEMLEHKRRRAAEKAGGKHKERDAAE